MTDAERIAALLRLPVGEVTSAVEWRGIDDAEFEGSLNIKALAAMLIDVRREERGACEAEIESEIAQAKRDDERMAVKFLGWALEHIKARGGP